MQCEARRVRLQLEAMLEARARGETTQPCLEESQHQHNVGDAGTQAQKQLCTREVHLRPTEQRWQEQTLGLPEYNE